MVLMMANRGKSSFGSPSLKDGLQRLPPVGRHQLDPPGLTVQVLPVSEPAEGRSRYPECERIGIVVLKAGQPHKREDVRGMLDVGQVQPQFCAVFLRAVPDLLVGR